MKYWVSLYVWLLIIVGISSIALAQSGGNRSNPANSPTISSPKQPVTDESTNKENRADVDSGEAATLKIYATLVTVPVVVSDNTGRYVPFLKSEDFKLFEDGVSQDISFFVSERVPVNVALILDTSGSIKGSMAGIQESAIRFVHELRVEDQVMVVEFNSRVKVLNELTSDRDRIRQSILETRAEGGTRLNDALIEAASRMKAVEGRKAIILLTDGEDTTSDKSAQQAMESVLESGALMYIIQFPATKFYSIQPIVPGKKPPPIVSGGASTAGSYPDSRFLHELVEQTGGDMYYAGGQAGLPNIWGKIAEELRYIYVLGYYPTNAIENGGYRQIRVQLSRRETGKVRYKPGYSTKPIKKQTGSAKSS